MICCNATCSPSGGWRGLMHATEREAIVHEQVERLWNAIRQLPLADRQIVCLHLEGLSAADIEEITGVSAGNVATRLTRIRQRLVIRLRAEEVGQ